MKTNGLSLSQKELLAKLGNNYTHKYIDLELCIYRNFDNYDVEVSGGHTKRSKFNVYVWQRKPHLIIVERHLDIPHDYALVADMLDDITRRYEGKKVEDNV